MKVLVIDDSALMRKHLRQMLEDAGFEVETARNGEEGLEKIVSWEPDVVTLDINMPVMDGLTCLSLIMQRHPLPVVMVSSLTEKGALATFEALELGAVDYVSKPGGTVSLNIRDVNDELIEKVRAARRARISRSRRPLAAGGKNTTGAVKAEKTDASALRKKASRLTQGVRPTTTLAASRKQAGRTAQELKLVIIGVSTGGPGTIEEIVTRLPADFPLPVVIAQHMPGKFTRVFAQRLNKTTPLEVIELKTQQQLEPGMIVVAHGDADIKIIKRGVRLMARAIPISDRYLWHPSVERLAESVLENCEPASVICVQLTGMGNDGARPMAELYQQGAHTIAESEETAVVYGMPRELVELGGAECVLPAYKIADQLIQWAMA